jgi:hypothetical protein
MKEDTGNGDIQYRMPLVHNPAESTEIFDTWILLSLRQLMRALLKVEFIDDSLDQSKASSAQHAASTQG